MVLRCERRERVCAAEDHDGAARFCADGDLLAALASQREVRPRSVQAAREGTENSGPMGRMVFAGGTSRGGREAKHVNHPYHNAREPLQIHEFASA
jgi:hypothetical protein